MALGSVSRTLPIPGLAEHAMGFKTLADAIALRNHLLRTLEMAESVDDPREREKFLTYVFVGGGYAGVEGLAELQDFAADVIDLYPRSRVQGMRWMLVEASDRIMREIPPDLAAFTMRELQGRGLEFRLDTQVEEITAETVRLSGGETLPTRTLVWTAGVRAPSGRGPARTAARARAHRGRRDDEGRRASTARGRSAMRPPCPTRPRSARRPRRRPRSTRCARASAWRRTSPPPSVTATPQPFTYKTLGVFVDLGRFQAVASTLGIRWRGFPAWFLARTYHLMAMPGFRRQLRLVADWSVDLLFPRDASDLAQLGHPPALEAEHFESESAGGTSAGAQAEPASTIGETK